MRPAPSRPSRWCTRTTGRIPAAVQAAELVDAQNARPCRSLGIDRRAPGRTLGRVTSQRSSRSRCRARGLPHGREGQRPAEPHRYPDRFQGPALATVMEDALEGHRARPSTSARGTIHMAAMALDTFSKAWQEKGGWIGERVIYEPEQPSYNTRPGRSPAILTFVIFDFPGTYERVGPAPVRTGGRDRRRTFTTDGVSPPSRPAQEDRHGGQRRVQKGTAHHPRPAPARRRSTSSTRMRPDLLGARRSTPTTSTE